MKKAEERRDSKTYTAKDMDEFERILNETPGFIKAMWCGDQACEDAIKERTAATSRCEDKIKEDTTATSRCMPFEQEKLSDTCICCGKKAKHMVYWGRAY